MFKEALQQRSSSGVPFVELLKEQEVQIGIKVDEVGSCDLFPVYSHNTASFMACVCKN